MNLANNINSDQAMIITISGGMIKAILTNAHFSNVVVIDEDVEGTEPNNCIDGQYVNTYDLTDAVFLIDDIEELIQEI